MKVNRAQGDPKAAAREPESDPPVKASDLLSALAVFPPPPACHYLSQSARLTSGPALSTLALPGREVLSASLLSPVTSPGPQLGD